MDDSEDDFIPYVKSEEKKRKLVDKPKAKPKRKKMEGGQGKRKPNSQPKILGDVIVIDDDTEEEVEKIKPKETLEEETSLRKELQTELEGPLKKMRDSGEKSILLSFPNEIITRIFSFLLIKDRMRARLNKTLNAIELESKYYVNSLIIEEISSTAKSVKCWEEDVAREPHKQRITFFKNRSYSSDCIKRLTHNASIGNLSIRLTDWKKYHYEIYKMIKEFNSRAVDIGIDHGSGGKKFTIIDDSFFLDLSNSCKELDIAGSKSDKITPEALHQNMKDGSLLKLSVDIFESIRPNFFNLIGIAYNNGNTNIELTSNRDIEAFRKERYAHIFDGNLEIFLRKDCNNVKMKLHETQESLEKAKKTRGFRRIDLTPK